ncbi:hypothetical protein [Flyfo podovirus Tbat2_2]|nr:hypothetical protein [Flyfo podovirus Tbat2_2]
MSLKINDRVAIMSGVMKDKTGVIVVVEDRDIMTSLQWYQVKLPNIEQPIYYLANELMRIN